MKLEDAVRQVTDYTSLIALFTDELGWDIDPEAAQDDVTFEWSGDELNLNDSSSRRLNGGAVRQLRLPVSNPPWGIFFVEFAERHIYRTVLRQVLRGLVPKRRRDSSLPGWKHDNLLFICTTRDYQRFTFAHFRGQDANRAVLATFGWEKGDTHIRTLCEINLRALAWPDDTADVNRWREQWSAAFDVEAVTAKFFDGYRVVFEGVEAEASKSIRGSEACRLYTQRLFNRLMFIYFIQKKGWLSFGGDRNYLRALFNRAEAAHENFLRDRLYWLFFYGMSNVGESREVHEKEELRGLRGDVPYLNGGLFDMEDGYDERGSVKLSNQVFRELLDLFERYNFTVLESTPLDVQVAVDPEMLGKVFEELVTGRHESGSYYTPRPVVSFMCREALKLYLASVETERAVLARFVDDGDASELKDAEGVLDALKRARICDPACGSGAYLLGMLQELLRLRAALFTSSQIDDESVYRRKREIIENNLYGVDKDRFAIQIACLRLWLSLAIESDKPQPLPNLDFKIACGDSLSGPAPNVEELQLNLNRTPLVLGYQQAKSEFLICENSERKRKLREKIDDLQAQIALSMNHRPHLPSAEKIALAHLQEKGLKRDLKQAEAGKNHARAAGLQKKLQAIKKTIAEWDRLKDEPDPGFDWAVEFAEVFAPRASDGARWDGGFSFLNDVDRQPMFTEKSMSNEEGGFDIVLANPPYVRADAQFKHIRNTDERDAAVVMWKEYRTRLLSSRLYKTIYEKWDLYVPFLERAYQLLRDDGQMVFIIPDAYNGSKYGSRSQEFFVRNACIERIDFCTDIPLFKAGVNNTIVHFSKAVRDGNLPVRVRRWGQTSGEFEQNAEILLTGPQAELGTALFRPESSSTQRPLAGSVPLGNLCYVSVGMVIHCDEKKAQGLFKAEDLVSNTQDSKHPKPYVEGKDIGRWCVQRVRFLEYGTKRAPAMFRRRTFPELHQAKERLLALRMCGAQPAVAYDTKGLLSNHTVIIFVPWHQLKGVRNKSIKKTAKYSNEAKRGETRSLVLREQLEDLSRQFEPRYLLAVMNSTFARGFVNERRRSKLDIYPDDWKPLPIPPIALEQQQEFVALVDRILIECSENGNPFNGEAALRVEGLEREIDERVASLYSGRYANVSPAFVEATSRPFE